MENDIQYYLNHTVNIIKKNKEYKDQIVYISKNDNSKRKLNFRKNTALHIEELYNELCKVQKNSIVKIDLINYDSRMNYYRINDVKLERLKKLKNL